MGLNPQDRDDDTACDAEGRNQRRDTVTDHQRHKPRATDGTNAKHTVKPRHQRAFTALFHFGCVNIHGDIQCPDRGPEYQQGDRKRPVFDKICQKWQGASHDQGAD